MTSESKPIKSKAPVQTSGALDTVETSVVSGRELIVVESDAEGLPFAEASEIAWRLFRQEACRRWSEVVWSEYLTSKVKPKQSVWPYSSPYRLIFGVWRRSKAGKPDAKYGLAVRVQSPFSLKSKKFQSLKEHWESVGQKHGMPVSFKRISPIYASALPDPEIGGPVGAEPKPRPMVGAFTAFVKYGDGKKIGGLTAAHVLDAPGHPAKIGCPIYWPFPKDFDPNIEKKCGDLLQIDRLSVDPMRFTDAEMDGVETFDVALFSIEKAILNKLSLHQMRRPYFANEYHLIKAPVRPESLGDNRSQSDQHPLAYKVRSKSPDSELRMTGPVVSAEVIMPNGDIRAVRGAIEYAIVNGAVSKGDSGSLIVDARTSAAVAMLIGYSRDAPILGGGLEKKRKPAYYALPLLPVFEKLGLKLP